MVARFLLSLALASPWSDGQGISVKSTQTRDLLNPGQRLWIQEKQTPSKVSPALVKHLPLQEIPPPIYTFNRAATSHMWLLKSKSK